MADLPIVRRSEGESLIACPAYVGEESEAAAFGTAFHEFAASYQNYCRDTGQETAWTEIDRMASKYFFETGGVTPNRLDEYKALCDQWARTRLMELDTLIHVEHTITHTLEWAILRCTIDRVDRADDGDPDDDPTWLRVTDWKTEYPDVDHTFQIRWYCQMLFLNHRSVQRIDFQIDHVRWNRRQGEAMTFMRGQLDDWWAEILPQVERRYRERAGGRAQARGGSACIYCALRYTCPKAIASARIIPETDDQADELFQETVRFAEGLSLGKDALKTYYSTREARVVGGLEIGNLEPREDSFRVTATPMKVKRWMDRQMLDVDVLLKVDTEKLGTETKRLMVDAGLAEWRRSDPSFKWRAFQPPKKKPQRTEVA
jgi:hypothetical protein